MRRKPSSESPSFTRRLLRVAFGVRGATTVEYALILVAVVLLGAGSFKLLGPSLGKGANKAGDQVTGGGGGGGGTTSQGDGPGGKGGGQGGGGGGGGGGGAGQSGVASKVSVGGVGGGAGQSGQNGVGSTRDTENSPSVGPISTAADRGGNDVSEGFGAKRWFGIGLLAAGVIAIGYVLMSMKRSKKAADAAGPNDKGGPKKGAPKPVV